MIACKELRERGTAVANKQINILVLVTLIFTVITAILSISYDNTFSMNGIEVTQKVYPLAIVEFFLSGALSLGYASCIYSVYRDKTITVGNLFDGFRDYVRALVLSLLRSIYVMLWTMLLIIPGIIAAISYSMAEFVLIDNPKMSANEAITRSKQITSGYKGKIFLLGLSWIGWILLSILTLGILLLWVQPRMVASYLVLYRYITERRGELPQTTSDTTDTTEDAVKF